ncbi:hypothetical protein HRH59_05455 [Rheinheimera sp. YQF-2]|uniref:Polysaccharide lyase 14 domain-containing protein n=1 Tax=Rheinheimera lutimaris TaxID=2740584 RepID=A0A7Y5EH29_9GAMM|nr:hypothetical protein [Rheinheimera lutimaris]NRQ42015.1 hypothetical protein [Rheinheimera lutimaris]
MVNIVMWKISWLVSSLLFSNAAFAAPQPVIWHEGTKDIRGATQRYSYHEAFIEWQTPMGDWYDKAGNYRGDLPFSMLNTDQASDDWLRWDLTAMLQQLPPQQELALLLRSQPDSDGYVLFASKEKNFRLAPSLVLEYQNGDRSRLSATMDSYLDTSTHRSLGQRKTLKISEQNPVLLRFDLSNTASRPLKSAILELHRERQSGSPHIGVYQLQQPALISPAYPAQLATQAVFTEDFSQPRWAAQWQDISPGSQMTRVAAPAREPGLYALKVSFTTQRNVALNISLYTKQLLGAEPDSLFFEYDLYLDRNWLKGEGGGKFPGFAGTYGRAGWGGRKADGTNGWSARGQFLSAIESDDDLKGLTPLGSYLYLAGSTQSHGEVHPWRQRISKLQRERWYKISQQLTLNTPGKTDGELIVWIDGQLVMHRTDLNFRSIAALKIERLWFNFYHGGADKPRHDMDLYISNVRVARP